MASSGASRLKPLGINVHEKIGATHWFLNGKDDVRSSHYLEDPATEFDIQGQSLIGLASAGMLTSDRSMANGRFIASQALNGRM